MSRDDTSVDASATSTQFHLARPVAPMGHGWMAISPTEVQSHCNFRDVTGGHEVVIDGALSELSEELDSMSDGEETNEFPEKKEKNKIEKM